MKKYYQLITLFCSAVLMSVSTVGYAKTITVETVLDKWTDLDNAYYNCVNKLGLKCSLREAIAVANHSPGTDYIILPAQELAYTLTLEGLYEDNNAKGDLDLKVICTSLVLQMEPV